MPALVQRFGRRPLFWGMPILLAISLLLMALENALAAQWPAFGRPLAWLGVSLFFLQQVPFGMHWALVQEFVNDRIGPEARATVWSGTVARRPTRLRAAQRVAIFSAAKPRAHRRAVWRWPRRSCTDHRRHDRAPTRTVTRQRQSRLTATASKALALLPKAARSLLPSKLRNSNAAPKEHYDRQPLQATKARRENLANRDGTAAHGSHGHDREIQRPRSTNSPPFWAASERRNSFSNSPIAMV